MLSQSASLALRRAAQVITLVAILGLSFILVKGAIMFSLLLLAKCMVSLMAYPIALSALSTAMTALLQYQLVIAALLGPLLLGPYLFRKFASVTGITSEEHPYSATQFVREILTGLRDGFFSFCALFKRADTAPVVVAADAKLSASSATDLESVLEPRPTQITPSADRKGPASPRQNITVTTTFDAIPGFQPS